MLSNLRPAVVMIAFLTLLTGLVYPLAITGIAHLALPAQAGGSLVKTAQGTVVGSTLIAQSFARPGYLHPRGSSAGAGYDASNSSGSNLGPMDQKLTDRVAADAAAFRKDNQAATLIPADAVTQSGSGLDPDVSPQNAALQAPRIAAARGASLDQIDALILRHTEGPVLGFIGQPHINVLAVNRDLDSLYPAGPHPRT
jgi:K+-transporting ATPase ATPase C chain